MDCKMETAEENLFLVYAKKIKKEEEDLQNIYEKQGDMISFSPYKVQNLTAKEAIQIYSNLQKRYNNSSDNPSLQNWFQSEKKIFVWFMVLHTYFLKIEPVNFHSIDYGIISQIFFNKNQIYLQFHFKCLVKNSLKINWTNKQDDLLKQAIRTEGEEWSKVSKKIFVTSNRTIFILPKACSERWGNHLDCNKIHGDWTNREDMIILQYVADKGKGKRWAKIALELHNKRTEHMVKNRYNHLINKNKFFRQEKERIVSMRILKEISQINSKVQNSPNQNNKKDQSLNNDWSNNFQEQNSISERQNKLHMKEEVTFPQRQVHNLLSSNHCKKNKNQQRQNDNSLIKQEGNCQHPCPNDPNYPLISFQKRPYIVPTTIQQKNKRVSLNSLVKKQEDSDK